MAREVLEGLRSTPKTISPKYLYDEKGSALFEQICETPEYYLFRTEMAILTRHVDEILSRTGGDLCLIEPGAGACRKARLMLGTGAVSTFVPVDISSRHLIDAATGVALAFPEVSVNAVAMDFLAELAQLRKALPGNGTRLIFYPGSSIGNFEPAATFRLLAEFADLLEEEGMLLIGYDLQKHPHFLERAYNDAAGVTSAFNLNLLTRLNRELGADFDVTAFRHIAFYNDSRGRIEMHLESLVPQKVRVAGETIGFRARERIHTENSYKHTIPGFDGMARSAGLEPIGLWTDEDAFFAVALYRRHSSMASGPEGA
jgi:dimethylhistidine N-methyltransferase